MDNSNPTQPHYSDPMNPQNREEVIDNKFDAIAQSKKYLSALYNSKLLKLTAEPPHSKYPPKIEQIKTKIIMPKKSKYDSIRALLQPIEEQINCLYKNIKRQNASQQSSAQFKKTYCYSITSEIAELSKRHKKLSIALDKANGAIYALNSRLKAYGREVIPSIEVENAISGVSFHSPVKEIDKEAYRKYGTAQKGRNDGVSMHKSLNMVVSNMLIQSKNGI